MADLAIAIERLRAAYVAHAFSDDDEYLERLCAAFSKRVTSGEDDECWPWTGMVNGQTGYGQHSQRRHGARVAFYAHRLAWEIGVGPIGPGLTVDHLCQLKTCCNPAHMEIVSLSENGRRGNLRRWGTVGDANACRHGHVGERAIGSNGRPYCRACNREKLRARRAAARSA